VEVLFERVAGLDVGKASVTVCVRTPGPRGRRVNEVRTFPTMTRSLRVMRDWLVERGVTIAAIESTSTYWKPPFYCLEEVLEVWLLNAAHMKAVPQRKTDVRDAEWIAQLLEHGLLRPSFVPPPDIRRLRMLTRYRVQLMGDRTRELPGQAALSYTALPRQGQRWRSLTSTRTPAPRGARTPPSSSPRSPPA
jgi:transposase